MKVDQREIISLFKELVAECPMDSSAPPGHVTVAPDGTFHVRYSNRKKVIAVRSDNEIIERYAAEKRSHNEDALKNAYRLVAALFNGGLVDANISWSDEDEIHHCMLDHKYKVSTPFEVGNNLIIAVDKEGHVDVTFNPHLPPQETADLLLNAIEVAKKENQISEREDPEMEAAKEEGVRIYNAMNVIRSIKFRKEGNTKVPILCSDDPKLSAIILRDSEIFSPLHIHDLDGNLGIRIKGSHKISPIDPETFKPQDSTIKKGEYEWVIIGQEILSQLANQGVKFSGSSSYRTNKGI